MSPSPLREQSLNTVVNHFHSLPSDQIPPGIAREIVHRKLARGNVSAELLRLCVKWKVKELSFLNLTRRGLTSEEIQLLTVLGEHVEEIRFKGMHDLDNNVLLSIFQNYGKLKRFQYTHSTPFKDNVAMMIVENNPNLEHFDVGHTRVTDETLYVLAGRSHLKAVDVSYNMDITDDGVLRLCEGLSKDFITDLRIDMCGVNDVTVSHIIKICSALQNISTNKPILAFNSGISRPSMRNMTYFVPWSS